MKRFTLLLLIVLLILPGTYALAQDDPPQPPPAADPPAPSPPVSGPCDLFFWLDDFSRQLDTLQSLEQFGYLVIHVGESLVDCGEEWLNTLPALLFGAPIAGFTPPSIEPVEPIIVDDGVLSPEEAEMALQAALLGDADLANQYFCEEDQLSAEDADFASEGVGITRLKCARVNEQMICEAEVTFEGETVPLTLQFDIVGETLCGGDLAE